MSLKWVRIRWGTTGKLTLPVSPQEVEVKTAATFAKHTIIGLGEVEIPNGSVQTVIAWDAVLLNSYEEYEFVVPKSEFKDPQTIISQMKTFRTNRTVVTLTIDDMLSEQVQLSAFTYKKGAKGDYNYSIEWKTAESAKLQSEMAKAVSKVVSSKKSTARASKSPANPYSAKKGQTLFAIAKKVYKKGSKWKSIYTKNKAKLKKAGLAKKKNTKLKKNMKLKW